VPRNEISDVVAALNAKPVAILASRASANFRHPGS